LSGLRTSDSEQPLSKAEAVKLVRAVFGVDEREAVLEKLLDVYYDGGAVTKNDMLEDAITRNYSEAVSRLCTYYHVSPEGKGKESHLVDALCLGYEETARVLVDKGANIEKAIEQIISKKGDFDPDAYAVSFSLAKKILTSMREKRFVKLYNKLFPQIPKATDEERVMLTALSMNGLLNNNRLAKITSLSEKAAKKMRRGVEKKFRLRYVAELDINKLGYLSYMVMVKFGIDDVNEQKPDPEEIKRAVENQPEVQLAMVTEGEYDLVMYILARNDDEVRSDIYNLRSAIGASYYSHWYIAPFFVTYGFVPIRERFFDVLKERVWKPTKAQRRPNEEQLFKREWAVLKELCKDGKVSMSEIDKIYGFESGRANYAYAQLKAKGVIKRITAIQNLPLHSDVMLAKDVIFEGWAKSRESILKDIIEDTNKPVSKYPLVGDVALPVGVFYIVPSYSYNDFNRRSDIEDTSKSFENKFEGSETRALEVIDMLVGIVPYRLFDYAYTNQFKILVDEYGAQKAEKKTYGEAASVKYGIRKEILPEEEIELT
jgi:DNA-binding Lrp family transcriptional regulator